MLPLDQEQIKQTSTWLTSKGVGQICKICNFGNLEAMGQMLAVPYAESLGPRDFNVIPDKHFPLIATRCRNCGNVQMFDARRVGLA